MGRHRLGSRRLRVEPLESRHLLAQLGGLVIDQIFPVGDVDFHQFTITQQHLDAAAGAVRITLSLSDSFGTFIPQATLHRHGGVQIGGMLNAGSKNRYTLNEPGIYTVMVRDNDHRDVGGYAIALAGLNPPSSDAVTITPARCIPVASQPGQIATYTFTASAGDLMTISLADTSSSARVSFLAPSCITRRRASGFRCWGNDGQYAVGDVCGQQVPDAALPHTGLYVVQVYDNNYTHTHANGYAIALEGLSPPSENAVEISAGMRGHAAGSSWARSMLTGLSGPRGI
jgi:hypothetical protein